MPSDGDAEIVTKTQNTNQTKPPLKLPCSQRPCVLFLQTEGGLRKLPLRMGPRQGSSGGVQLSSACISQLAFSKVKLLKKKVNPGGLEWRQKSQVAAHTILFWPCALSPLRWPGHSGPPGGALLGPPPDFPLPKGRESKRMHLCPLLHGVPRVAFHNITQVLPRLLGRGLSAHDVSPSPVTEAVLASAHSPQAFSSCPGPAPLGYTDLFAHSGLIRLQGHRTLWKTPPRVFAAAPP